MCTTCGSWSYMPMDHLYAKIFDEIMNKIMILL